VRKIAQTTEGLCRDLKGEADGGDAHGRNAHGAGRRVRSAPGSQASTRQAGIRIRYREWAKLWAQVAGLK